MTESLTPPPVADHDYCDRHPTVKAVSVAGFTHWLNGGMQITYLYFCGNCHNKHRDAIDVQAFSVVDGTWKAAKQ